MNMESIARGFYFLSALAWYIYALWWVGNTYSINLRHTRRLQHLGGAVILFKLIFEVSLTGYFASLYYDTEVWYWILMKILSYILCNTVLFTCLLLVSKGWSVTRQSLDKEEMTFVGILMVTIFLGYCAYALNPQNLSIILVTFLGFLFYMIVKGTSVTIRGLPPQEIAIIKLYRQFRVIVYLYFTGQILCTILFQFLVWIYQGPSRDYWLGFNMTTDLIDSILVGALFVMFRSKDRGGFPLSDENYRSNEQTIPLVSAKVPEGFKIDLSDIDGPVVIITPERRTLVGERIPYQNIQLI